MENSLWIVVVTAIAVVAFVGGFLVSYLRYRAQLQSAERDTTRIRRADAGQFWEAFEKRIAILKERLALARDDERGEIEDRLRQAREEYENLVHAWQQTQKLAALAPRGALEADTPKLSADEIEKVRALLGESAKLPLALLSAHDYFIRGNAYYEARDYQQALEAYNRALQLRPDFAEALNNRGKTLENLDRNEEALKDYNRALELRPDFPEALNSRGIILRRLGRYDEALRDYNRALELKPDDPVTLNNRGDTLHNMGRYEDALQDFNRAFELRPDSPVTLNNRSIILLKLERYDDAFKDINRALDLRPGDAGPLYNRACAYSRMGKFEEALRDLEAAITRDEKYRQMAKTDEDFDNLRNDPKYGPRFRALVGE